MIADHPTAGCTTRATRQTITVAAHLLPTLRTAGALLIAREAERVNHAGGSLESLDAWTEFLAALDELEEGIGRFRRLQAAVGQEAQAPEIELGVVAPLAEEAAAYVANELSDGIAMERLCDSSEGLQLVAAQVALARDLRELADEVGGED